MLPDDDVSEEDLPEVSLADADITTSSLDANDGPPDDDLNDDGLPDPADLDDDLYVEEMDEDAIADIVIAVDPDSGATVPDGYDDADDDTTRKTVSSGKELPSTPSSGRRILAASR